MEVRPALSIKEEGSDNLMGFEATIDRRAYGPFDESLADPFARFLSKLGSIFRHSRDHHWHCFKPPLWRDTSICAGH